jgi:hypothetical protein
MTVPDRIKRFIAAFVQPVQVRHTLDSIAYHSQPNEMALRFSPSNALRRNY